MRLVLDTNVVVSGLIWGGPPRGLLDLAREGRVALFSSGVLLDELASVLERDKFAAFLASRDVTPAFLMRRYGMLATLVNPTRVTRTVPADADDDHVIGAALGARADAIAAEYVSDELLRRHGDAVWRVRLRGHWLYGAASAPASATRRAWLDRLRERARRLNFQVVTPR